MPETTTTAALFPGKTSINPRLCVIPTNVVCVKATQVSRTAAAATFLLNFSTKAMIQGSLVRRNITSAASSEYIPIL